MEFIFTINTSNLDESFVRHLLSMNVTYFRVNSSFLDLNEFRGVIENIRKNIGSKAKILVDLPGFKIRALHLKEKIEFSKGMAVRIRRNDLNYPVVVDELQPGMFLHLNDGMNRLTITEVANDSFECLADSSGVLRRGKGLHFNEELSCYKDFHISEYDRSIISLCRGMDIDAFGLSFVRNSGDVAAIMDLVDNKNIECIPKIESRFSVENFIDILLASDKCIIDRGDLAGEVGIERVLEIQDRIITTAKSLGRKAIVATQNLKSFIHHRVPFIPEVNEMRRLKKMGCAGFQLSEETCVAHYSREAVEFINKIVSFPESEGRRQASTVWLLGPTGSGKTTLGLKLCEAMNHMGFPCIHYDGDVFRNTFADSKDFSRESRLRVVNSLVEFAARANASGVSVVVSALTAHEASRAAVRSGLPDALMCYLDCSIKTCSLRDHKGLYEKAAKGELDTVIGVNEEYMRYAEADAFIDTERFSVDESYMYLFKVVFDHIATALHHNDK